MRPSATAARSSITEARLAPGWSGADAEHGDRLVASQIRCDFRSLAFEEAKAAGRVGNLSGSRTVAISPRKVQMEDPHE